MIHATEGHLRQAYQKHFHSDGLNEQSRLLLLFYAVECGLKSAWLRRNRLRSTSQLDSNWGHDLGVWVKELRLPASTAGKAQAFRLRGSSDSFGLAHAHQAWRYGMPMNEEDELQLALWLEGVRKWIKTELAV